MLQSKPFHVYKSSAGSGKTFTLAKVFLSIALQSKDPLHFRKILAITFTVKAANEMKERIVSYLSSISGNGVNARKDAPFMKAALAEETGMTPKEIEFKCDEILKAILHNYGDLSILTIDKFITRLVKSFASELSLSPDFEIEIDHSLFLDQIIELLYAKIGDDQELTHLILEFLKFRLNDEKSGNLDEAIKTTAFGLLSEEFYFIQNNFKEYSPTEIFDLKSNIDLELDQIEKNLSVQANSALDLIHSSGIEISDLANGTKGIYSFFLKIANGELKVILEPGKYVSKTLDEDKWQSSTKHPAVISISPDLREIAAYLLSQANVIRHYFLLRAVLGELFKLGFVGELNHLIEQFKESENIRLLSDFNRLISEQFLAEQTPFIFERLGTHFDSILIDEFQDTSNLQWLNLLPLIENSLSEANTSLIVGDAKQSIYRFRGSEPQQFIDLPYVNHQARVLLESSYQEYVLNSNYRSAKNIVDFNNRFFNQFSKNMLSNDMVQTYSDLKQECVSDEIGEVNWWFTSPEEKAKKDEAMQMMVERTIHLIEKESVSPGDVCCLFRMNNDAAVFASSLLKYGVNVISEESLLLKNNPAVALIISTLTAIRYPKDNFHLQQWLSKYHHIAPINDYHLLAENLKKEKWSLENLMHKMNLKIDIQLLLQGEMFSKVFNLVKLFNLDVNDPFILKLLDFCTEFEASATYLKSSFLDHWKKNEDSLSIQLPEGKNAVRVMSIHKSKGLEFPIVLVFVPTLTNIKQTKEESWISLDKELGIQQISIKTSALKSTNFESVHTLENDKSSLDFVNMLYVAFTRAEKQLEIFSKQLGSANGSASFIQSWNEWDKDKNRLHFGV